MPFVRVEQRIFSWVKKTEKKEELVLEGAQLSI